MEKSEPHHRNTGQKMFDETIKEGLELNGFHIQCKIGEGGYAQVFTVSWDNYPRVTYIAKVISIQEKREQKVVNSFFTETSVLEELYHKNIITIFKHFVYKIHMFIIMEYCPNGTLQDFVLKNGPLKENLFRTVAQQCLEAISTCHQSKIAHRDLKPANILLDSNYNIKICDFGISCIRKDYLTRQDGSLAFTAPEMLGSSPYDPMKSDIWSLGITFYFLITGGFPFSTESKSMLIEQIKSGSVYFPPFVNQKTVYLISQMVRKFPDDRPTAAQLLKSRFFNYETPLPSLKIIKHSESGNIVTKQIERRKRGLSFHRIQYGYTSKIVNSLLLS